MNWELGLALLAFGVWTLAVAGAGWWLRGVTTWQITEHRQPGDIPKPKLVDEHREQPSGREEEIGLEEEP